MAFSESNLKFSSDIPKNDRQYVKVVEQGKIVH